MAFDSVDKSFGRTRVLTGLSLAVAAGSYLALTGANGSGKTTVMRLAAGLTRPDRGGIAVAGVVLPGPDPRWRTSVGFASHETSLYADLTARENLVLSARLFGLGRPGERVERAASWLGLGPMLDRQVRALSRGMRQRVALTRALLHEPAILLLDEPFTGLDEVSAARLAGLLGRHHRGGGTIVVALHDLAPVEPALTRIVALAGGRVSRDSAPELAVSP